VGLSLRSSLVGTALLTALLGGQLQALAQSTTTAAQATTPAAGNASNNEENSAGAKGAKTYCFMRAAGNTHTVSWNAAYALIKRQSASLFKTSPEHAAVMITEAVVNNPTVYPDCGKYLGDLYTA
jgi:hypothetical protein